MELIYRPLDDATWPGPFTPADERKSSPFRSDWHSTVNLLDYEVDLLAGDGRAHHRAVLEVPYPPAMIRQDGTGMKANAADPRHPGVALSVDTEWAGPLRFATDRFKGWRNNVRAIALGIEALRKMDRYGITRAGEQYRGWSALGTGEATPLGAGTLTRGEAARVLADAAGWEPGSIEVDAPADIVRDAYRDAARSLHPDAGGPADGAAWALVTKARDALLG